MAARRKPAGEKGNALRDEAKAWLDRIASQRKAEQLWSKDARVAVATYTGETEDVPDADEVDFNILFSNVETMVPATINSPPQPDIRRRFAQDDPVAKDFAELLERVMRIQIDDGKLQVELEGVAQDAYLAGRGIPRLRFKSDFEKDGLSPEDQEDVFSPEEPGAKAEATEDTGVSDGPEPERVTNERICFEAVSWADFVRGPAKRWEDVPWEAFRHTMPCEDIDEFADPALVAAQMTPDPRPEKKGDQIVWEVWVKKKREVLFIREGKQEIIKRVPDPLGWSGFFPNPRPVQPIEITGRLMPVNPYKIYRRLAEELNTTTIRINAILKQLKVKGAYAGDEAEIKALLDADTNDFVPIGDVDRWAQVGLDKAIVFWPVEKLIVVLRELYVVREQTKQAIYEITGISDIVRGASQARETATAQQIKTQWGSLRIQKMQRMMERCARDLFIMMSEIIPAKFSLETLQKMTGIQLLPSEQDMQPVPNPLPPRIPAPPQGPVAPQQQQAMQMAQQQYQAAVQQAQKAEQERQKKLAHIMQLQALLKDKVSTYFRVDVETDSTVKADLTRQKQEATEFMAAAGQYFQAVAPIVGQGALTMEAAIEVFSSFSRFFNLGKSVEDVLDRMLQAAREKANHPQQPQPSPEQIKAQAEAEARKADMAAKDREYQFRMTELDKKARSDAQTADLNLRIKGVDLEIKNIDKQMKEMDLIRARTEPLIPQPVPQPVS